MQADLAEQPRPHIRPSVPIPSSIGLVYIIQLALAELTCFLQTTFHQVVPYGFGDSSGDSINAVKTFALRPLKHIRSIPESVHGEKS